MTSRGKNFTEKEKYNLLELVQKYKHVIENKCTNAVTTVKKNEVWEVITNAFNSTAEIPRTQKQLTTAYLNLKRSTRQNVANENVKKYLKHKQNEIDNYEGGPSRVKTLNDELNTQNETDMQELIKQFRQDVPDQSNTQNETAEFKHLIKQFKKEETADKKGIRATGGGTYKSKLSDIGAKMLAMMGDQIKPLSNSCDSASSYYKNDEDCEIIIQDIIHAPDNVDIIKTPAEIPQLKSIKGRTKMISKKTKKNLIKNEALKQQFYKKMMECVLLEKKIKIMEYKTALKQHRLLDIEIKIKQKEYENLIKKSM